MFFFLSGVKIFALNVNINVAIDDKARSQKTTDSIHYFGHMNVLTNLIKIHSIISLNI